MSSNSVFEFEFYSPTCTSLPPESSSEVVSLPEKRKRGRPLGSKNKKPRVEPDVSQDELVEKRKPGRPRGTGPKQRAQAQVAAENRRRQIKWKPGLPLRVPGTLSCSTSSANETTKTPEPSPQPPNTPTASTSIQSSHNHTRSAVDSARQLANAEIDEEDTPRPSALPENEVPIIDDIEDDSLLQSFISEGLGDDNSEGDDTEESNNADNAKRRRALPQWFQALFQGIVEELDEDRKAPRGRSRHYEAGTFWIPRKAIWFHLHKQDLKPSDIFLPKFFLWDPADLLGGSGIPCPDCGATLTRDGIVKRPRRVVDIDSCFWLIGYSYKCRTTSAGGCNKKFRSWNHQILEKLPRPLAMEFPARLTWRSALSWRAFGIVRSCIQHGIGTSEVAEIFRMQHLRRYDELRLQYLHTKIARVNLPHQTYEPFLPFEDNSDKGFHGFTPSGQWLRDVYDDVIEAHRDALNQHTAMLSANVCAIDHSFKIAKHVFKVDGVPIFTALLTVTNEKGEIRVCLFVATKSYSQYTETLRKMSADLTLYGHLQPTLFYTDNMVDKGMLESIFSSLLDDVVAVDKHAHLPIFSLPPTIPHVLDSISEINNAMRGILDDISITGHIVVGFDSEWNVDTAISGRITGCSPPSVMQIAYKDQVYILQIGEMLSAQKLPHELVNFLTDERVVKAGRLVNGDLRQLAIAAGYDPKKFKGGLDLAAFAKQKLVISNARISLADLTAKILGRCLPKNQTERISSNWSARDLSSAQIDYAARDAYVCLCIYNKLLSVLEPTPLPSNPSDTVNLPVIIMTDDHKNIAARGVVSQAVNCNSVDDINISPTRTVISVKEVLIPATIMTQHKHHSLHEMGTVPFDVVVHRAHVRVIDSGVSEPSKDTSSSKHHHSPHLSNSSNDSTNISESSSGTNVSDTDENDGIPISEVLNTVDDVDALDANIDPELTREADPASERIGAEMLGERDLDFEIFKRTIRSRVVKDVFHVFHMLYISRSHGLRVPFAQALRDAILIPHPEDRVRIEAFLKAKGVDWDHMLRYNSSWLWRHCRRTVPPPEVLYPMVHAVLMTWGPLKDAKTGVSLFNRAAWKTAKNILELVRNGHISDPPSISLYYVIGFDKHAGGLPIYRCIRGTNTVEGGVHTHLRRMLPSCGASVRHMMNCLLDFILRHNLLVGTFNSTGKKFDGHDSIWLLNEIQELEITLSTVYPSLPVQLSWINGNLYQKTTETMGLTQISTALRIEAGMQEFVEETDGKQKQSHLAQMQGTRRPILPVHTIAERKLFNKLMRDCPEFRSSKTSISISAVKIWNRYAESEEDIFYKLEEHLTTHFSGKWQDVSNSMQSISQARPFTEPLQKRLSNSSRSTELIKAPAMEMSLHRVNQGFRTAENDASSPHNNAMIALFSSANSISNEASKATLALSAQRMDKRKLAKTGLVHDVANLAAMGGNHGIAAAIRAGTATHLVLLTVLVGNQVHQKSADVCQQ